MEYCAEKIPAYKPLSVSGYHIREAGSTAAQELAFTLADGFGYVELGPRPAASTSTCSPPGCRSSSTPTSTSSRRSRSSAPPAGSGRAGCATSTARRPRRRSGCGSTPRPPASRSPRSSPTTTSSAPASRRSRPCSAAPTACTPTRSTRRWRCPSEQAAEIALRTQQVIMEETGVVNVADPLGGSWYVEALTDQIEAEANAIFDRILAMGGSHADPRRHRGPGRRHPRRREPGHPRPAPRHRGRLVHVRDRRGRLPVPGGAGEGRQADRRRQLPRALGHPRPGDPAGQPRGRGRAGPAAGRAPHGARRRRRHARRSSAWSRSAAPTTT